jgi:Flp pilus assembly protein TadB
VSVLFVVTVAFCGWCLIPAPTRRRGCLPVSTGGPEGTQVRPRHSLVEDARVRTAVCAIACALLALAFGGARLAVAGAVAGLAVSWWLGRMESPSAARFREQFVRELPVAIDLLAACARAGQPLDRSLVVVSRAVGGPVAQRLAQIGARLRLGVDPASEWRRLGADPFLAPLARAVVRSLESGAPIAEGLERLAADRRRDQRMRTQQRARSVGVRSAAPLAGCFLPAFMLVGVVPMVAGAFSHFVL